MNEINVIAPYKYEGIWVFDDARVDLVQEPFVSGADTMIDLIVADIPGAGLHDAVFGVAVSQCALPTGMATGGRHGESLFFSSSEIVIIFDEM